MDVIADVHHLPFRNGVFAKVRSSNVLEHSPNPLLFLKEQYRVLLDGGEIELTTDNAQNYSWSVLQPGRGGINHPNYCRDHYMIFYPENVLRLMRLAKFKHAKLTYILRNFTMKGYVVHCLAKLLVYCRIWRKECLYYRFCMGAQK